MSKINVLRYKNHDTSMKKKNHIKFVKNQGTKLSKRWPRHE